MILREIRYAHGSLRSHAWPSCPHISGTKLQQTSGGCGILQVLHVAVLRQRTAVVDALLDAKFPPMQSNARGTASKFNTDSALEVL